MSSADLLLQSAGSYTKSAALGSAQLSLKAAAAGGDHVKLRQSAEEFEAVFLSKMLETMFAGISTEAPFGGGQAEETWRGFLIEEYGKQIASKGGLGLADSIHRQLLSLQEVSS